MDIAHWLQWTYLAYVVPVLLAALTLHRRRLHNQQNNHQIQAASNEAGLNLPPSLHPVIDYTKCIGCEACVHACPEFPAHRVLGVIRGTATLISPSDCIGHGACKTACPVGAIRLVFGTAERGVDIPVVKPSFETSVPGIYIAGELGGMGLIRNAIEQGRQAMVSIQNDARFRTPSGEGIFDVCIVGAGPAGLAATLKAHEAGLNYLTLEQDALGGTVAHFPRGKLVMTAPATLPIIGKMDFRETSKETLMAFWQDVVKRTEISIHYGERVTAINHAGNIFELLTETGNWRAKTVLLALGRRGTPRKLGVPGEDLPKITYSLSDPAEYRGRHVLVVGGGDSALEAAIAVADHGAASVTLSYRSPSFTRAKARNRQQIEAAASDGRITVLMSSSVKAFTQDEVVIDHEGRSAHIRNDAALICAGGILPTGFLRETGIHVETKHGTE